MSRPAAAHRIVHSIRRWLPGPEGVAGAAAATGDPSRLLGLETGPDTARHHTDPSGPR